MSNPQRRDQTREHGGRAEQKPGDRDSPADAHGLPRFRARVRREQSSDVRSASLVVISTSTP